MFVTDLAAPLLRECINATVAERCPGMIDIMLRTIELYDGVVFGSTMVGYLLDDASMNDIPAADLDVLFRSRVSYDAFNNYLLEVGEKADKKLREQGYTCEATATPKDVHYTFSALLATGAGAQTVTQFRLSGQTDLNSTIRVHAIYLQPTGSPTLTSIHAETYIQALFNELFLFDFTKVVCYQRKVYAKLPAINYVELPLAQVEGRAQQAIVNKYTARGIVFNITPAVEQPRAVEPAVEQPRAVEPAVEQPRAVEPAVEQPRAAVEQPRAAVEQPFDPVAHGLALSKAKRRYQADDLVVLPLTTTSRQTAGKAPACRGWNYKDLSFDFDATRYANIGILCGKASGIVCIDVDSKDNGMFYFSKMVERYGLPDCPMQLTPNAGRHYIFKYDEARMSSMKAVIKGAKVNGKPVGIDFWIQKCQFVVEPSINYDNHKRYQWAKPIDSRAAIPELPEWIYELYHSGHITEDGVIVPRTTSVSSVGASPPGSTISSISSISSTRDDTASATPRRPSFDVTMDDSSSITSGFTVCRADASETSWMLFLVMSLLMLIGAMLLIAIGAIALAFLACMPATIRDPVVAALRAYITSKTSLFNAQ